MTCQSFQVNTITLSRHPLAHWIKLYLYRMSSLAKKLWDKKFRQIMWKLNIFSLSAKNDKQSDDKCFINNNTYIFQKHIFFYYFWTKKMNNWIVKFHYHYHSSSFSSSALPWLLKCLRDINVWLLEPQYWRAYQKLSSLYCCFQR